MKKKDLQTYDPDNIQAFVNRLADPYVRSEIYTADSNGKKFIVNVVHEFDEIPVVCRKSSGNLDLKDRRSCPCLH